MAVWDDAVDSSDDEGSGDEETKETESGSGTESAEDSKGAESGLTVRSVCVGLVLGTLLTFTNMYFGLQTGWVTMGSIQAAVVGFAVFQLAAAANGNLGRGFSKVENVVLQTVSVATATLPLAGGFVGILPALALLDPPVVLSVWEQVFWSAALTYFGIFFAIPLRRQTILEQDLAFPSGTATASIIEVLHSSPGGKAGNSALRSRWRSLLLAFAASFLLSLLSFVWPAFETWPVLSWIGLPVLTKWHWVVRPSLSYIGQGMIMGQRSALSMLGGAITSWAVLGPTAMRLGWVNDDINDWQAGPKGWVLWVSIGLMLAEALTSLALISLSQFRSLIGDAPAAPGYAFFGQSGVEVESPSRLVPMVWWGGGLAVAVVFCSSVVSPMFSIPLCQIFLSVVLSCLVAIIAVRALGQTDLNPVSGVGKLSQIIFAVVAPGHIVTNLVAGALAEAGATQAGDLMQDLKTAHLLGASPRAMFFAQLLGATWSIFVTVAAYQLYDGIYGIPSEKFEAPVAHIWVDMATLMNSGLSSLPRTALKCAGYFAGAGVLLPLVEECLKTSGCDPWFLPSGMAWAVGMYLTADWTLPRAFGSLIEWGWRQWSPDSHDMHMLMVASGLVLGEGCMSIFGLVLTAAHVPTLR